MSQNETVFFWEIGNEMKWAVTKALVICCLFRGLYYPNLLRITSRAGQAGGGSFQKKTPISQRKNLPIECAQGDRPARCPFHAHDPRVWVDARHQITATVPNHRTVRAATKRHLQSMRQQHATGRPQRQAWHANQTQVTLQGTTRCYYKVLQVLHSSTRCYKLVHQYYSVPQSTTQYYQVPPKIAT